MPIKTICHCSPPVLYQRPSGTVICQTCGGTPPSAKPTPRTRP